MADSYLGHSWLCLQIAALEAAVRDAEALVSEPRRYHYGSPQEVKAALTTMLDNCAK